MNFRRPIALFLGTCAVLSLAACERPETAVPEHRISVILDPQNKRQVAVPKPCPNWKYDEYEGLENHYRPEFNCAQQYNLGAMISRPNDLLAGQTPGGSDANPGVLGVERYRKDEKKQLINPKEISGSQ